MQAFWSVLFFYAVLSLSLWAMGFQKSKRSSVVIVFNLMVYMLE